MPGRVGRQHARVAEKEVDRRKGTKEARGKREGGKKGRANKERKKKEEGGLASNDYAHQTHLVYPYIPFLAAHT